MYATISGVKIEVFKFMSNACSPRGVRGRAPNIRERSYTLTPDSPPWVRAEATKLGLKLIDSDSDGNPQVYWQPRRCDVFCLVTVPEVGKSSSTPLGQSGWIALPPDRYILANFRGHRGRSRFGLTVKPL